MYVHDENMMLFKNLRDFSRSLSSLFFIRWVNEWGKLMAAPSGFSFFHIRCCRPHGGGRDCKGKDEEFGLCNRKVSQRWKSEPECGADCSPWFWHSPKLFARSPIRRDLLLCLKMDELAGMSRAKRFSS